MVKRKSKKSRYPNINLLHKFINVFIEKYPAMQLELQLYDKHHGGSYVFIYNEKTIARIYPLLEAGWFTLQYKEGKITKTIRVYDSISNAKALVQMFDLIESYLKGVSNGTEINK